MVAVYFGAQLIKGGGGDAGHDGPNLHKLSNLAQLRLALPEPARELPGTPLSGWKRAGRLPRRVLQARTPVADPRFGRYTARWSWRRVHGSDFPQPRLWTIKTSRGFADHFVRDG